MELRSPAPIGASALSLLKLVSIIVNVTCTIIYKHSTDAYPPLL